MPVRCESTYYPEGHAYASVSVKPKMVTLSVPQQVLPVSNVCPEQHTAVGLGAEQVVRADVGRGVGALATTGGSGVTVYPPGEDANVDARVAIPTVLLRAVETVDTCTDVGTASVYVISTLVCRCNEGRLETESRTPSWFCLPPQVAAAGTRPTLGCS